MILTIDLLKSTSMFKNFAFLILIAMIGVSSCAQMTQPQGGTPTRTTTTGATASSTKSSTTTRAGASSTPSQQTTTTSNQTTRPGSSGTSTQQSPTSSGQSGIGGLSNDQIVSGLKEALSVGAQKSSDQLSLTDGFFKNLAVKILMPPEAKDVESKLRQLGMGRPG